MPPHWCSGPWVNDMLVSDLGILLHWILDPCHLGESSQNQLGWIPNALNIDMIVLGLKAGVAVSERLAHKSLLARGFRTGYNLYIGTIAFKRNSVRISKCKPFKLSLP